MSRANREAQPPPARRPDRAARRRVRRLHLAALIAIPGSLAAGAFELWRALGGNQLSWAYAVEWPVIAGYGIHLWRTLVREQTQEGRSARPPGDTASAPTATPADVPADPGLEAWQEYLARLHASQPPGGPPAAHTG